MTTKRIKILVTGGSGQIGTELIRRGLSWQVDIVAPKRSETDITDEDSVYSKLEYEKPDMVVNSAAFTAVDSAEIEIDLAFKVNQEAPQILARSCQKLSIPLIHLSTDYVFDGTKKTAYEETDSICPIGVYGQSKEAGEVAVRQILSKHIILRTSWVYASHGSNFLNTMLRIGKERETLNIVDDQFGAPTFAGDIADSIFCLTRRVLNGGDRNLWGTYHYTAKGNTTWKDFAEEIFEKTKWLSFNPPSIKGISSSQYPTPAKRPLNSILNCNKIDLEFAPPRRAWQCGLEEVLEELKNKS